ncbi:MAG: response regulator [Gemmatimonadales bacterium]
MDADIQLDYERGRPLVLVVDDEPMVRSLVTATLRADYRVLEAADGQEALALVEVADREVSAIVTDVVMPGMGGVALAEAVGQRSTPPPILFISGYGGGELPGPFLAKPFRPDALLRAVAGLLAHAS